ncbi:MAG: patatin-like phospholipase family protein [Bacteroidota bacterium]
MVSEKLTFKQKARRFFFSFPVQLVFVHLKRSHFLLLFWLLLFTIVTHTFGRKYGLPYLFLYPEYLGDVNFWSHAILGFSCGGFIMAFNMYSYVMHGYKFSFIATVSKPFYKFSINNFVIPALFVIIYVYQAIIFQYNKEFVPVWDIILNMLGYFTGMFIFFFFSFYYFFKTNKDLSKLTGKSEESMEEEIRAKNIQTTLHKKIKWYEIFNSDQGWRVETYLASPFKIKLARDSKHYDIDLLKKVFAQNHINASIFEFAMILSFLLIGSMGEYSVFIIPAGASVFLLFTMLIMLISAIYSWLRGWTITFLIFMFIFLNYLSTTTDLFSYKNFAYGLDYSNELAEYSHTRIHQLQSDSIAQQKDIKNAIETLNLWKEKNTSSDSGVVKKPKMVIICTSGGGLRSAMWTFHVLQKTDSALNGNLMKQSHLITGSSGGMIGAAYYRELFMDKQMNSYMDLNNPKYTNKISKDVLNAVSFTIATNDLFIRYRHFDDGPYSYTIDRGYMFEKQLNNNIDSAFDKRLFDYIVPEKMSEIPTMIISPTIINDGRRLVISSQPMSFLSQCNPGENVHSQTSDEYVEFTRMFYKQNAYNLRFSSALRMSASFPYVMPMVSLPSEPSIEVMDAGYRDNYGVRLALRYIYTFRYWLKSNTSGVIILQIRDRQKEVEVPAQTNSVTKRLTKPLGNLYDNIFYTQDYDNDQLLQFASGWFENEIDVVNFCLPITEKNRVSLSWHLTQLEKQQVANAYYELEGNRQSVQRLKMLLE